MVGIFIENTAPNKSERNDIYVLSQLTPVLDAPAGETILAEYSLTDDGTRTTTLSSPHSILYQSCKSISFGRLYLTQVDAIISLTEAVVNGSTLLSGLPDFYWSGWALDLYANNVNNLGYHLAMIPEAGSIKVKATGNIASGNSIRIHVMYYSK